MVVFDNFDLLRIQLILQETNSSDLLIVILAEIGFWIVVSAILVLFIPKKYNPYRKEIFIFFLVINVGLLFMGMLLTLLMLIFGFSWATHRVNKPSYEVVDFDEYTSSFPMVYSKFHEGVLAIEHHSQEISSDEKIKSLKILYDSNAQGNIGKIKLFLSDSSDETRLYAFALISSYEKRLNSQLKELQDRIDETEDIEKKEGYYFNLALTYWQFIFHGVANERLVLFYTQKIEDTLESIKHKANASVLLGKIYIFNHRYKEAEEYFKEAIKLGATEESVSTFFAEAKYGQKAYNEVSQYMSQEEFAIDLRMKPLYQVWKTT